MAKISLNRYIQNKKNKLKKDIENSFRDPCGFYYCYLCKDRAVKVYNKNGICVQKNSHLFYDPLRKRHTFIKKYIGILSYIKPPHEMAVCQDCLKKYAYELKNKNSFLYWKRRLAYTTAYNFMKRKRNKKDILLNSYKKEITSKPIERSSLTDMFDKTFGDLYNGKKK